ncbi:hypothetical protein HK104_005936, partial [Borealophlyctis nickersoniae]
ARVEGLERGADDYLSKPFGAKELVARVKTHLELGRLRGELMHLARLSPVGIFRANAEGKVIYRSRQLIEISGASLHDPHMGTVHPEDAAAVTRIWDRAMASQTACKMEYRYLRPRDGRVVWCLAQWAPEVDENGRVVGYMGAVTDITERVEQQKQQLQEAEENRKSQEMFIDMISHEIRNPISGVLGNLDLLRSGVARRKTFADTVRPCPLREEVTEQIRFDEECLDAIESCARHQQVITEDVLHLSKLKSGSFVMNDQLFDPLKLVAKMVNMYKAEMESKGLTFTTRCEWEYGRVFGDPERLSQVLINLISNAVKFTEKCPERRIELTLSSRPGDKPMLCVSVSDTGIGMSKEAQTKLFERFSQATIRTHREYGGTGLGLHICKQMVQVMGGDIGVESELGKGTKFSFYVPVGREAPSLPSPEVPRPAGMVTPSTEQATSPQDGYFASKRVLQETAINGTKTTKLAREVLDHKSIHVLIVEDNLINQRVLKRQLELGGFVTSVANNGAEALRAVEGAKMDQIDIILMDVEMPIMDGMEATTRIREREAKLRANFEKSTPTPPITPTAQQPPNGATP